MPTLERKRRTNKVCNEPQEGIKAFDNTCKKTMEQSASAHRQLGNRTFKACYILFPLPLDALIKPPHYLT